MTEKNRKLSNGQSFSSVTSIPKLAGSKIAVYTQDAAVNGMSELYSVNLGGDAPVKLSSTHSAAQTPRFDISPDGNKVVYITDQTTRGIPDLYSVPTEGGQASKLSMNLAGVPGQVRDFVISPNSLRAYYVADGRVNNVMELWRVDLNGGPSTRMNRYISSSHDVFEYKVNDLDQIVYRIGRTVQGGHELWMVNGHGVGTQAKRISVNPMVTGGGVSSEFHFSDDDLYVVYTADAIKNNRNDLYSVPVIGGPSERLDKNDGRSVRTGLLIKGNNVIYSYSSTEYYSVPISGGPSVRVQPPPVMPPVVSPDGDWQLFVVANQGLFASYKGGILWRVSCPGQTVQAMMLNKPAYSITSDSSSVVYINVNPGTSSDVWIAPISGAIC